MKNLLTWVVLGSGASAASDPRKPVDRCKMLRASPTAAASARDTQSIFERCPCIHTVEPPWQRGSMLQHSPKPQIRNRLSACQSGGIGPERPNMRMSCTLDQAQLAGVIKSFGKAVSLGSRPLRNWKRKTRGGDVANHYRATTALLPEIVVATVSSFRRSRRGPRKGGSL